MMKLKQASTRVDTGLTGICRHGNRRAAPVSHARRSIRSRGVALRYIDAM